MRKALCNALVARSIRSDMVFLTGDLGFMALEELQNKMQSRFINAGVAEQNMVSVAAAMVREGLEAWVYTIAPFCYARPFEQIRNDVAFPNLPVKLIGNGGGYGYGVMGPTHHAIEDYGVLLTLPHMRVFIPVFNQDIDSILKRAGEILHPSYIRLGRDEAPLGYTVPEYAPWRQLTYGGGVVVIVAGPIAGTYIEPFQCIPEDIRPNLWIVTELPLEAASLPTELIQQISSRRRVCVVEEHVRRGGLGSELGLLLLDNKIEVTIFDHLYARAHHYATSGSQHFLRSQSGLDAKHVLAAIMNFELLEL